MTNGAPLQAAVTQRTDPDSRARTHLANERTFLAWLRTGLSMIAVGMAAASFLPIDLVPGVPYIRWVCAILVLAGTLAVGFGTYRYVIAHREIEAGAFVPAIGPVIVVAVAVAALGLLAIPLVVLLR